MIGSGVTAGLARSPFLADVDLSDRTPGRIVAALLLGPVIGAVAAMAAMIFVLSVYTVLSGEGARGLDGLRTVVLMFKDGAPLTLSGQALQLMLAASVNGVFALGFVAVAAEFARRPLHAYFTAAPRLRWRLLLAGLVLSTLAMGPVMIFDRLTSGGSVEPPLFSIAPDLAGRLGYVAVSLLFIPAAAAEEIFFRGWFLRLFAAFSRRPAILIVGTAIAFSAIHLDFNPDSFLTRALMGAGFAYMTLRLGGIEFSTAVHATNNILIILFVEPLTLQTSASTQGFTPASVLEDAALVAGYVLITEVVARWPAMRRWAGVRLEDLSPVVGGAADRSR